MNKSICKFSCRNGCNNEHICSKHIARGCLGKENPETSLNLKVMRFTFLLLGIIISSHVRGQHLPNDYTEQEKISVINAMLNHIDASKHAPNFLIARQTGGDKKLYSIRLDCYNACTSSSNSTPIAYTESNTVERLGTRDINGKEFRIDKNRYRTNRGKDIYDFPHYVVRFDNVGRLIYARHEVEVKKQKLYKPPKKTMFAFTDTEIKIEYPDAHTIVVHYTNYRSKQKKRDKTTIMIQYAIVMKIEGDYFTMSSFNMPNCSPCTARVYVDAFGKMIKNVCEFFDRKGEVNIEYNSLDFIEKHTLKSFENENLVEINECFFIYELISGREEGSRNQNDYRDLYHHKRMDANNRVTFERRNTHGRLEGRRIDADGNMGPWTQTIY